MKIVLPFPDPRLSPNKRLHWAQKIKIKQEQKEQGYYAAYPFRSGLHLSFPANLPQNVHIKLVFYPKHKHYLDLDNTLAASKALLDGVASGLGIDDRRFRPITLDFGDPDKSNPRTELEIL